MNLLMKIPENEIIDALLNDYKRKLVLYRLIDNQMQKKYKSTFEKFEENNLVKKSNFSWEVESDSMEWEHSVEGIRFLENKINDIINNADNRTN